MRQRVLSHLQPESLLRVAAIYNQGRWEIRHREECSTLSLAQKVGPGLTHTDWKGAGQSRPLQGTSMMDIEQAEHC